MLHLIWQEETEPERLVNILQQISDHEVQQLEEANINEFETMFRPLDESFIDDGDQEMSTISQENMVAESSSLPADASLEVSDAATVGQQDDYRKLDEVAYEFGFKIFKPPPSITKHPPPAVGKDDDIHKLKEILDEILIRTDSVDAAKDAQKILFGPDQKIGENMLRLIHTDPRYQTFLLEFPCLHLRKSRITNVCSAYKDAGLLHIMKYMRDEEFEDWGTLISIQDINKATRYIKRISLGLHVAVLSTYMASLSGVEQHELLADLLSDRALSVSDKWDERYRNFLEESAEKNATFSLHIDIMKHCDEICALHWLNALVVSMGTYFFLLL